MDAMVSAAESQMVARAELERYKVFFFLQNYIFSGNRPPGVELDAANIGLRLEACHRVRHVGAPQLHAGVVAPARDQLRVDQVEVNAPAALLVLLPHRALGVGGRVPHNHCALVVAAGKRALVEAAP